MKLYVFKAVRLADMDAVVEEYLLGKQVSDG